MSISRVASESGDRRFSESESDDIRKQIDRILTSSQFKASRRCQLLLQYVTECALKEQTEPVKERTLGIAVFGRNPDYDTSQDPVVRTTAGEIRKKLAQYYQEPDHEGEIRTALLPGSYIPEFHIPTRPPAPPPEQVRKSSKPAILRASLAVAILACFALALPFSHPRSNLDDFWQPVTRSADSVLLCLGQTPAYVFASEKTEMEMRQTTSVTALARVTDPGRSLVAVPNRYVALGDALCFGRLAAFLEKSGSAYIVRGSPSTTFSDLRDHAAILVGAFNNEWTLRLLDTLRFRFVKRTDDPSRFIALVEDRQHPERSDWKLINSWPAWHISADYAIVSRILDPGTDRMTVTVAGITQFGTIAAGEFLTRIDYFNQAVPLLPKDWKRKNVQIVIEVPVVKEAVSHPKVLAAYAW